MEDQFKNIASLVGDPTRATILWVLLDGRAFTATELAIAANTSPQNISMHLNKLLHGGLLAAESQGRHRYYKFAGKDVAYAIEALATLVPQGSIKKDYSDGGDTAVKYCRTCYDHLAGKVGVLMADALIKQGLITSNNDKTFDVTKKGARWMNELGIDINDLKKERRPLARACLDWSERRHHVAGALGAALLNTMLSLGWVRRVAHSRAMVVTGKGQQAMEKYFKVNV